MAKARTKTKAKAKANQVEKKTPKNKVSPIVFFNQVKAEMKKVTWPSRQETTVSTVSVFIMVVIAAGFLFFADQILSFVVDLILGFGM